MQLNRSSLQSQDCRIFNIVKPNRGGYTSSIIIKVTTFTFVDRVVMRRKITQNMFAKVTLLILNRGPAIRFAQIHTWNGVVWDIDTGLMSWNYASHLNTSTNSDCMIPMILIRFGCQFCMRS